MIDIALKNVFRQKVRSLLTMLGIAMGIGLIIALGAIGEGLSKQIEDSFGDLAAIIDVRGMGLQEGITEDMISSIQNIEGVARVIPIGEYRISRGSRSWGGMMGHMFGGGSAKLSQFTAISPEDLPFLIDETISAERGRKIETGDDEEYYVLLGYTLAQNELLNVGDEIEYERTENNSRESFYFEILGILEETGDALVDGTAYVPLLTMQELEDDETISRLKVKAENLEVVEKVTQEIQSNYPDELRAFSAVSIVRSLESTLGTITLAVYGIGAVSIVVGGIGIMNTMIMSVMERRREIGIMKAIGATTSTILTQVLEESAILSVLGGGIGILLGYGATNLVIKYSDFNPIIGMDLVIAGFVFSLILGMGAGLYPAWAASRLDPIEVLRYE